jgi:SAM-dependent methyltransferase
MSDPTSFRDRFAPAAKGYAEFRPDYPPQLYSWLASLSPDHHLAWDCACGSGQAALGLAAHFGNVIATDASRAQLAQARPHPRVRYARALAERPALRPGSIALATVAQAFHWFDRPAFLETASQALRPRGILAIWCYQLPRMSGEIDAVLDRFYKDEVGPWWGPERRLVDEGYAGIPIPFEEMAAPSLAIVRRLRLEDFLGYVGTWSAVLAYERSRGRNPVPLLAGQIAKLWGDDAAGRTVTWPLVFRVGRLNT